MKKKKNQIKSLYSLGLKYLKQDNLNKSKEIFTQITELDKFNSNSYSNIGLIQKRLNNLDDSLLNYKKAIKINKKNYIAYNNLANIYKEIKLYEKAKINYLKSISINPNYLEPYINLALLNEELGNFKESKKYYKKALVLDINNLEIYLKLSQFDQNILNSNLEKKVNYIIKKKDSNKKNIVSAYYLKAKYHLMKNEFNKEFNCLLNAHDIYFELEKKKFIPNLKYWLEYMPNFQNLNFKKNFNLNNNFKNLKPIFIVGLPRSGSTILEKILISGDKHIISGEETGILNNIIKKRLIVEGNIKTNDKSILNEIINNYINRNILNVKKDVFTDKSLENFFFINLILYVFPKAKIVHCKRNIKSCVISIIKNNLKDLPWAHKLDHIYKYINIYFKTINFYKTKFPSSIFEVNLEDIIKNPEIELKKVFNYCELPWHPKSLNFYKKNDITSKTASNIQIRKPINTHVENHDHYKNFLDNMEQSISTF